MAEYKDHEFSNSISSQSLSSEPISLKKNTNSKKKDDDYDREVDFHHKVAYRFEKTYRLSKVDPQRLNSLNFEIIAIIKNNSSFI